MTGQNPDRSQNKTKPQLQYQSQPVAQVKAQSQSGTGDKVKPLPTPKHRTEHMLGHGRTRDIAEMRRDTAQRVSKILGLALDRLEREIDKVPLGGLAVTVGILVDKQLALEQGAASTLIQNNTIVVNGLSRGDALSFLRGELGPDRFNAREERKEILADACAERVTAARITDTETAETTETRDIAQN